MTTLAINTVDCYNVFSFITKVDSDLYTLNSILLVLGLWTSHNSSGPLFLYDKDGKCISFRKMLQ